MRGTMWLIALGCGILLSSSGCCGFMGHGCCGRGGGCESCDSCEGDCGPTCGPARRVHRERVCADDCGECGACPHCGVRHGCGECGDECGGGCCQSNFCIHPFRWIGRLFYAGTWCGPSCGGGYWGEAISDPPACHEPCSHDGHWTGHAGCASCNHGGGYETNNMSPVPEGAPVQDDPALEPTPAPKPAMKATRRTPSYNYER